LEKLLNFATPLKTNDKRVEIAEGIQAEKRLKRVGKKVSSQEENGE
jgi:hypothetical protein